MRFYSDSIPSQTKMRIGIAHELSLFTIFKLKIMLQPSYPGVYVEEIPTSTPNVVQVRSDIPAFVGMTARITSNGINGPVKINSLVDYETHFGRAKYPNNFQVELSDTSGTLKIIEVQQEPMAQKAILYYAMRLFFMNGGGSCYIVPIDAPNKTQYANAIQSLTTIDEISLIVLPDASLLLNAADYYDICNMALQQCGNITNRFAILDVLETPDGVQQFRNHVVTNLRDGAAYTPYLSTNISFEYNEDEVQVTINGAAPVSLSALNSSHAATYNFVKTALDSSPKVILPPSAAVAGIYVRTDRERGVWKAPANAGIVGITGTTRPISEREQETLNVDPVSGKSINAIRTFPGRGTRVWGARTLAGNDNDYRYVSVQRFVNVVEASVHKASRFVAFEPNEPATWNRVRAMTENYLHVLWREGAIQGTSSQQAYFVNVGLGTTMSAQDLLEGRVIIQLGLAIVRPAEFVVIRIEHYIGHSSHTNTTTMTFETQTYRLMQTTMEWSDLVLNPHTKGQLDEISDWISYNKTLLNDWGMAGKVRQSFSTLFHGPSGTGKSLCAVLIGKTAKHAVHQVDLRQVLSKYIGETEKNLNQVFQQAAAEDSILFFDEADALFGKRTEVNDSPDHYANLEVSYVFHQIEKHSGLVIFAVNDKNHLDDLLLKRLDLLVEFPMPNKEERLELWRRSIPAKAKLANNIDIKSLAKEHELTGGSIMNVMYYACLQTLKKGIDKVELSDILTGIRRELSRN